MNRNWIFVFTAGFLEIFWVSGLKYADNLLLWALTTVAIIMSFCLLTVASKTLPIGTLYAVFAGIGTAGTVIIEMIIFGEPFNLLKVILIALLLGGVMGLMMISSSKSTEVHAKEAA